LFKNNKSFIANIISNKDIVHRKSKIPWKKIIVSIILILCIILIGFIIILNTYLNKISKIDITINDLNLDETIPKQEITIMQNEENTFKQNNDIKNIALFGIDEAEGIAGRSDCIMILTLDNKHKKLKLSSIIRDSYVLIPTKDKKDKINHAYAFGGPQLALQTINENFNLNLTQFVAVNFSSLPKIIDSIGGITLDITTDELKYINGYIKNLNDLNGTSSPNITTSGIQKVDGTQALAYCRIRYTDGGDFERSQRHRTVINQLITISKTLPLTQYPSLLDELLPLIHTNLETSDILSLAINLNSLKTQPLLQDRFPRDEDGTGQILGGIYYYVFNEESTTKKINEFIFENND
jgi:LCP family protein required for cell wall assembly